MADQVMITQIGILHEKFIFKLSWHNKNVDDKTEGDSGNLFLCSCMRLIKLWLSFTPDLEQDGFSKNPCFHAVIAEVPEQHKSKDGENVIKSVFFGTGAVSVSRDIISSYTCFYLHCVSLICLCLSFFLSFFLTYLFQKENAGKICYMLSKIHSIMYIELLVFTSGCLLIKHS